jgi:hypothetical protein
MRHHGSFIGMLASTLLLSGCIAGAHGSASDGSLADTGATADGQAAPPTVTPAPIATPTPTPVQHTLRGTMVVTQISQVDQPTDGCTAASLEPAGFDDIHVGAQVTVYDGAQSIMATTALTGGVLQNPSPQEVPDHSQLPEVPPAPADPDDEAAWEAYAAAGKAYSDAYLNAPNKTAYWGFCAFSFETSVADAEFYSVEVAHRGKVNFSRDQLDASDWTVDLSL